MLREMYIAGPLFSQAELQFNAQLKKKLSAHFKIFLPQEDGRLLAEVLARGLTLPSAKRVVYTLDMRAIRRSDILLIILDGRTVDEGAAFELGVATALGKLCIGLQTDPRRLLPFGNNPMIEMPLKRIFKTEAKLMAWARKNSCHQ